MLLEILKLKAGEAIFNQAVILHQSNGIKAFTFTQPGKDCYQIKAIVKPAATYGVDVSLNFSYNQMKISSYCTCSSNSHQLCPHTTAVIYRFLVNDLPKLEPRLIKPLPTDDLESLRQAVSAVPKKVDLRYIINGLAACGPNFQLALSADEFDREYLQTLVNSLGNINFSAAKRERVINALSGFDRLIINYLETLQCGKDSDNGTVFLPQSQESLNLVLTLISQQKICLKDTMLPLQLGETLKPHVHVTGVETGMEFIYDLTEFETGGFFNKDLRYILNNNVLQLIEATVLEKLPSQVIIPPEQLGEVLFVILPKLSEKVWLDLDPKFKAHQLLLTEPRIALYFDYEPDKIICQPEITLLGQTYHNLECWGLFTEQAQYHRSSEDDKVWLSTNRKPMEELLTFLKQHKFAATAAGWVITELDSCLKFMFEGWQKLSGEWQVTLSPSFTEYQIAPVKLEPLVEVAMDSKIDWFELTVYYNLGGQTYTQQQILTMLHRADSGNYIKSGTQWYKIEDSTKLDFLEQTFSANTKKAGPIKEKCYNIMFLRQLLQEQRIAIKGNTLYHQFETDTARVNLLETCPIPGELQCELRPYQREGFYWLRFLHKYHFGGILADDMGLGKTLQILTLVKSLPKEKPVLVICPRSLIYNWAAEIEKFYPGTAYLVYHGSPETRATLSSRFKEQEIIITTYDIIVNDTEILQNYLFYYCILDEAQHIKNMQTQRARECKKIQALYRVVMTGTPLENSLEDLWSLFDFLMPGYLESQSQFNAKYVEPLKKSGLTDSLAVLRQKLTPFMLRRLKNDVLPELPPKIISLRKVLMSQLQEDAYRTILRQVKQEVLNSISNIGLAKSRITVLSALTRLRQLCDHPSLALPEINAQAESGKIDALMELIAEAIDGGHKMVVFSQFVRMLKLIRAKLQETRLNYLYLDGSTSDRLERINCFNNTPEIPVFLISLKAGGVGINLSAADIVIHVDPWWNPMVEDQASDRVHRIGQQSQVMVYKLITIGTVEEKLIQLQARKKAVFEAVIKNNGDPINSLTWEDIQELFELK